MERKRTDLPEKPTSSQQPADDALPPLPLRFEVGARLKLSLLQGVAGAALLAVAAFIGQQAFGLDALLPLAIYTLLLTVVLFAIARAVQLRAAVRESRERAHAWQRQEQHARDRVQAVLGSAQAERFRPAQELPADAQATAAPARLERFGREEVAMAFAVGGTVGLMASLIGFLRGLEVTPDGSLTMGVGLTLAGLAFVLLVAGRTCAATPAVRLPESANLAEWLRGGQWMAVLTAVALLSRRIPALPPEWSRGLALVLLAFSALCAFELSLRGLWVFLRRQPSWQEYDVPARLLTLATLFHGRSPLHGALDVVERHLGLSLHTAWAIGFVRRSALPLVGGFGLLLWVSTSLVVVQPHEQGLRLRFGRLVSPTPAGPGLHLKLPWPLETLDRYPVRRAQTLTLGYSGPAKDLLLWSRAHTGVEYQLLLGDGRELVSVDATVTYRIRDVVAFALGFQNPREALDGLAYGLLLRATVATNLDHLLTADRAPFAQRFAADLQQTCDAHGLGLEILHVGFISLHPPVGIAEAYEDVVSAEIERVTRAARARAVRESLLPAAQAEATKKTQEAQAEAARRLANARGEAVRFAGVVESARAAPDLYRFRKRLEAVENALANRSIFVVDRRLRTETGNLWIDLRPRGSDAPTMENR